jgi:predicted nucleotidyltransferase
MSAQEIAIAEIKNFVEQCSQRNIYFQQVMLFGSMASNRANADSDIDVLLVSDQFTEDRWENAKLIARVQKHFSTLDVHTFPTFYFQKGDPFINEIKRTGILI